MKRYMIERDIPGAGNMSHEQLKGAAATSNSAVEELSGRVQWVESYFAENKTFCVYLAENADLVRDHARISGFPATTITEIRTVVDPTMATD